MTFVERKLSFRFEMGTGAFGTDGADIVDVADFRASVSITKNGGNALSMVNGRIWGLPLELMQRLTLLNKLAFEQVRWNLVTISAGDSAAGMGVIFQGIITAAWADANDAPQVQFVFQAQTGLFDSVKPVPPISFKGPVSVATLLTSIGAQMTPALGLENNGVDVILDNAYFPGTLTAQMLAISRAARCHILRDDQVIAIWPFGQTRNALILDVSASTGMVGYPTFSQEGLELTLLYTPSIVFGQAINVKSALAAADGKWVVASVAHFLDSQLPGGQWFTRIKCYLFGYTAPIIGNP